MVFLFSAFCIFLSLNFADWTNDYFQCLLVLSFPTGTFFFLPYEINFVGWMSFIFNISVSYSPDPLLVVAVVREGGGGCLGGGDRPNVRISPTLDLSPSIKIQVFSSTFFFFLFFLFCPLIQIGNLHLPISQQYFTIMLCDLWCLVYLSVLTILKVHKRRLTEKKTLTWFFTPKPYPIAANKLRCWRSWTFSVNI